MVPESGLFEPQVSSGVLPGEQPAASPSWHDDFKHRLSGWFGIEFQLVDGHTGDMLASGMGRTTREWLVQGELCRAVAAGGKAEIIEEVEPLLMLAIPVHADERHSVVAVGTFVTSGTVRPSQLPAAAELLGLSQQQARRWIADQRAWPADVLLQMGQLATERLGAEWRLKALDREMRELTLNLSATYEEISLIYRLTQNLKLTSRDDELASLALEWLADVLPAESLAIQLLPCDRGKDGEGRSEPVLLSYGDCPLECQQVSQLIEYCQLVPGKRPLIVNDTAAIAGEWLWPKVHRFIAVSLCEGSNCFGWLLAINRTSDGEFGTVEASLLSSVAAILGIHSGNAGLYQQQRELFKGMVRALTSAIDAKDPYTCGHSERVARVSVRLAEELGCDRKQVDTIYLSGLLHDVGKIGIDDNVLRKPGKLTEAEYEHIKTHAQIGHRILGDIKQLDDVLPVVLHHHEQWNGQGYPQRLAGDEIPLLARIVAVADSFDAMGSDRPYRQGMPDEKLDAILRAGAGQQWDARVVEAFFRAGRAPRDRA